MSAVSSSSPCTSSSSGTFKFSSLPLRLLRVDHAPTELVLTRQCASVSKLSYAMRVHGGLISEANIARFDDDLRVAIERTLDGAIPDRSWWQAELAVSKGGLGMRSAALMAPLAFLSSRVSARPMVEDLFVRMEQRGLGTRAA